MMAIRVKKNHEWKYCAFCGKYTYLPISRKTCSSKCSRKMKASGSYQLKSYWRKKDGVKNVV
jgi:predicted nucleic acid-binding Zn ribbon protein